MRCAAPSALLQRLRRATPKTLQPSGQRIDGCYTALLLPCASQRRGMRAPLAPLVHVAVRWRQACSCVLRLLIANPKTPRRLRPSTSNKDCRRPRPSSARPERRTRQQAPAGACTCQLRARVPLRSTHSGVTACTNRHGSSTAFKPRIQRAWLSDVPEARARRSASHSTSLRVAACDVPLPARCCSGSGEPPRRYNPKTPRRLRPSTSNEDCRRPYPDVPEARAWRSASEHQRARSLIASAA